MARQVMSPRTAEVVVKAPDNVAMATEPAETIGDIFANKAMTKTYVAAAITVLSGFFNFAVDSAMLDSITMLVMLAAGAITAIVAQVEASRRSVEQASATRDAVYSPASAVRIARANTSSVVTGNPVNARIPVN